MSLAPSPFEVAADLLWPDANQYLDDPAGWAKDRLDEFWWSGQREMAEMVVRNRYSAIKASHDVSKRGSGVERPAAGSNAGIWWLSCSTSRGRWSHRPDHKNCATRSSTAISVHVEYASSRARWPIGAPRGRFFPLSSGRPSWRAASGSTTSDRYPADG
jgi:hypothetical protein